MIQKFIKTTLLFLAFASFEEVAVARITFSPYYSVSSTKSISPKRKEGTETEKISQREEKGITAGISFFRFMGLSLSVGQNFKTTTTAEQAITDEYGQIDLNSDVNSSTRVPGLATKMKDTQNKGKFSFYLDPGFWIFVARLKVGVTATQRKVELFQEDKLVDQQDPPPTYKPHAGVGLGIRLSSRIFAMAEYNFLFYKFPEKEPFEREATISFGFAI